MPKSLLAVLYDSSHKALTLVTRKADNMAAPADQRIAVPIDDPDADTEWYEPKSTFGL
jgi:hypothetical protein